LWKSLTHYGVIAPSVNSPFTSSVTGVTHNGEPGFTVGVKPVIKPVPSMYLFPETVVPSK